jgi:hypothetical protein
LPRHFFVFIPYFYLLIFINLFYEVEKKWVVINHMLRHNLY